MLNTIQILNLLFCKKLLSGQRNSLRFISIIFFIAISKVAIAQTANETAVLNDTCKIINTFCVINSSLDSLLCHPFTHSVEFANNETTETCNDNNITIREWDKNGYGETVYAIVFAYIQEHIYIELINLESQNDIIDLIEGKENYIYGRSVIPVGCAVYNSYTYFILNDNLPDDILNMFLKKKDTSLAIKRREEDNSLIFTWKENKIYRYTNNGFVLYTPNR